MEFFLVHNLFFLYHILSTLNLFTLDNLYYFMGWELTGQYKFLLEFPEFFYPNSKQS